MKPETTGSVYIVRKDEDSIIGIGRGELKPRKTMLYKFGYCMQLTSLPPTHRLLPT